MLSQEVNLVGVKIIAKHGYYQEEQHTGNEFIVDVYTRVSAVPKSDTEDLKQTLNYEILYQIVKEEMSQTAKLLETLTQNILTKIQKECSYLEYISVRVKKMQPPMGGEIAYSEVVQNFFK